jgi:hypothetical protein
MACTSSASKRGNARRGARLLDLLFFCLFLLVVDGKAARSRRALAVPQAKASTASITADITHNHVHAELKQSHTCVTQYFTIPDNLQYLDTTLTGGGGGSAPYTTSGKGAIVTSRHLIYPSAWGTTISAVVGVVGFSNANSATNVGGCGDGHGGDGTRTMTTYYNTGGGGGTSLYLGVG